LDPLLRSRILFISGGDVENLPYLYVVMSHAHGPELLKVLEKKSLRGKLLTDFIHTKCDAQPLKFLKWVIREKQNVNDPKAPKVLGNGLFR